MPSVRYTSISSIRKLLYIAYGLGAVSIIGIGILVFILLSGHDKGSLSTNNRYELQVSNRTLRGASLPLTLRVGKPVTLAFSATDSLEADISIPGLSQQGALAPGSLTELSFIPDKPGTYEIVLSIPDQQLSTTIGTITVEN